MLKTLRHSFREHRLASFAIEGPLPGSNDAVPQAVPANTDRPVRTVRRRPAVAPGADEDATEADRILDRINDNDGRDADLFARALRGDARRERLQGSSLDRVRSQLGRASLKVFNAGHTGLDMAKFTALIERGISASRSSNRQSLRGFAPLIGVITRGKENFSDFMDEYEDQYGATHLFRIVIREVIADALVPSGEQGVSGALSDRFQGRLDRNMLSEFEQTATAEERETLEAFKKQARAFVLANPNDPDLREYAEDERTSASGRRLDEQLLGAVGPSVFAQIEAYTRRSDMEDSYRDIARLDRAKAMLDLRDKDDRVIDNADQALRTTPLNLRLTVPQTNADRDAVREELRQVFKEKLVEREGTFTIQDVKTEQIRRVLRAVTRTR